MKATASKLESEKKQLEARVGAFTSASLAAANKLKSENEQLRARVGARDQVTATATKGDVPVVPRSPGLQPAPNRYECHGSQVGGVLGSATASPCTASRDPPN